MLVRDPELDMIDALRSFVRSVQSLLRGDGT
jgi:hypothetical protein